MGDSKLVSTGGARLYAEAVLDEHIQRTERHTEACRVLKRAIRWNELSDEDEGLLWGLMISLHS